MNEGHKFGLLGKNISYSFSKNYFTTKFKELGFDNFKYYNFDIPEIEEFPFILYHKEHEFVGLNVTIPYKQSVMRYLDEVDTEAKSIGAVNTIKVTKQHTLIGYNTDIYGFELSLKPLLKPHHSKALILGSGGASKAIAYVLKKLSIDFQIISRTKGGETLQYEDLSNEMMRDYTLIVNCTPLGTYPKTEDAPAIPYDFIGEKHFLFDLIYNPGETKFLKEGAKRGATIKNGYEMLELQAEKAWEIWNSED